jgi:antitoxin FitA
MAQLVVRNLPDEIKERLKRRARQHGRSLEAEVRDILRQVPESTPLDLKSNKKWATDLAERMRKIGVTNEDVDALNESIADLRRDQRIRDIGT